MITFVSQSQQCDVADDLVLEVQKYLQVKVSQAETLEWWQEHKLVILLHFKMITIILYILLPIITNIICNICITDFSNCC